jgi:hypothetical protein
MKALCEIIFFWTSSLTPLEKSQEQNNMLIKKNVFISVISYFLCLSFLGFNVRSIIFLEGIPSSPEGDSNTLHLRILSANGENRFLVTFVFY